MKRLIILILLVLSHTAYSQQLTKELILPYKYTNSNTYTGHPDYYKSIVLDDSTFLMVTLFGDKHNLPEKIRPVLYKIRNSKEGFKILWQSKPYLDSTFSAYFGDMIIEDGKYKMVFLYQNDKDTFLPPYEVYYPLFIDIDSETGNIIDSVGYLGDFKSDESNPNTRIYYRNWMDRQSSMKYDGQTLTISMIQPIYGHGLQYIKNISRTGFINKVEKTRDTFDAHNYVYIVDPNNYYEYADLGLLHTVEFHSNYHLRWSDILADVHDNFDLYPTDEVMLGTGISGSNFRIFIHYRDKARTINGVYAGVYDEMGRIKSDTINFDNDVYFYPEFATIDENGVYYLSGFDFSENRLNKFQVVQYKDNKKKALIWKRDSTSKYIYEICPLKNDKALALGMIYDYEKDRVDNIMSFYIAEIDFSKPNGVKEETESLNLSLSPNPAGDFITVTVGNINPMLQHGVGNDNPEINIFNTLGERVMTVEQTFLSVQQIDISALSKGIYFVKAGGETAKFVKL